MAGEKLFINNSAYDLQIVLYIRKSENPIHNAGTQDFELRKGERKSVPYGNNVDIYLNGISITAIHDGQIEQESRVVIRRGSIYDNALNTNNTIEFKGSILPFNAYNT